MMFGKTFYKKCFINMARPTDKTSLLEAAAKNYENLTNLISSISPKQQANIFNFDDRDRNIRDVLVHLYEWHQLLLNWENNNINWISIPFLIDWYTWKTYPEMNIKFWEKHQSTQLKDAKTMLDKSHNDVLFMIKSHSNDELFTKKYYDWTWTTSLWAYCVSATSSHYDWAIKKLKKHIKTMKQQ